MVAATIFVHNRLDYCVSHRGESLRFYVEDNDQLDAFKHSAAHKTRENADRAARELSGQHDEQEAEVRRY